MLPYPTLIPLDRAGRTPLHQQITAAFIQLIQQGLLPAKVKLPGTRTLAGLLAVHRQTVVTAFEELAVQGWIEQAPSRGAFVSARIPEVKAQPFQAQDAREPLTRAGFVYARLPALAVVPPRALAPLTLDAGIPDVRLAPLAALARNYRAACQRPLSRSLLGYAPPNASLGLRQQLAHYLLDTRGVPARPDTVFISRGSLMAMYLAAQLLLKPGDAVVVGKRSYWEADQLFAHHGAQLLRVTVDEQGISVEEVEELCRHQQVRLLYITPHHHYPTTVTLAAERRVRLLQLAERYDFVILEDDYDFDYHYAASPILPLASADRTGRVLYVGSLSKVLAPAFRVGYLVGPADFVTEMGYLRRLIDHQGDAVLEQAIAGLFADGELLAHLMRARKVYQQRRDVFCQLLDTRLAEWFSFQEPTGGLAVWGKFCPGIELPRLSAECYRAGLGISDGQHYQLTPNSRESYLRLGFARQTVEELVQSVGILEKTLRRLLV